MKNLMTMRFLRVQKNCYQDEKNEKFAHDCFIQNFALKTAIQFNPT